MTVFLYGNRDPRAYGKQEKIFFFLQEKEEQERQQKRKQDDSNSRKRSHTINKCKGLKAVVNKYKKKKKRHKPYTQGIKELNALIEKKNSEVGKAKEKKEK